MSVPATQEAVRAHLEKVVASDAFARSDRMKRFLRFIVDRTLEGKAEELKEYSVAVNVFDRPETFDPQLDPIVRVEAGRLRSKLSEYYQGEGRSESLRITLRKRSYVPEFESGGPDIPPEAGAGLLESRQTAVSVAVLPFVDLSPRGDQEHLCGGITEEVVNTLCRVEGLRVASRTSAMQYKGVARDVRQIGEQLNVTAVLEGSARRIGRRLRVTAQLVSVSDGYSLWSELYDRTVEDIFDVQREISQSIVRALRLRLVEAPAASAAGRPTSDSIAYELCLQGRYWWNRRTLESVRKAARFFERAIRQDPQYANAYAGLADAYALLAWFDARGAGRYWNKAAELAQQALGLNEALGSAWNSLAFVRAAHEWRWDESEQAFERALALDAEYATAHHWYAVYCLAPQLRLHQALLHMHCAEELDPLSPVIATHTAWVLYFRREYDAAVEQIEKALRLDPAFHVAHIHLGAVEEQRRRFDAALAAYERAAELGGRQYPIVAGLARCSILSGRHGEAAALVSELRSRRAPPVDLAGVCAVSGDYDQAFQCLATACRSRCARVILVKADPVFDPLKTDPRFLTLIRKIGLDR